jgi:hypothetical protein
VSVLQEQQHEVSGQLWRGFPVEQRSRKRFLVGLEFAGELALK